MTARPADVRLRPLEAGDLPVLCQFQLDPVAYQLAGVFPRQPDAFHAHFTRVLADPAVRMFAVFADDQLVGSISLFQSGDKPSVGYWYGRDHWGRGIATRALALFLEQVTVRPLHATACRENVASCRALERAGFALVGYRQDGETERYMARETAEYVLG